jgi:hypothetical protein
LVQQVDFRRFKQGFELGRVVGQGFARLYFHRDCRHRVQTNLRLYYQLNRHYFCAFYSPSRVPTPRLETIDDVQDNCSVERVREVLVNGFD